MLFVFYLTMASLNQISVVEALQSLGIRILLKQQHKRGFYEGKY